MNDSPATLKDLSETATSQDTVPDDTSIIPSPPPSIPPISIKVRGGCFATQDEAKTFANNLGDVLCEVSRYIDMRTIDGVTVGVDYTQALAELDRGRAEPRPLTHATAEEDGVIGAAMAPSVLRDGAVKPTSYFTSGFFWASVPKT